MVFVIAAAALLGWMIAKSEPRIVAADEQEPIAAGADDTRIAQGAKIIWYIDYQMCGHSVTLETIADSDSVGLTFTQFCEKYDDVRVLSFSSAQIELKKRLMCYCPEHYILKKNGDMLAVYRTSLGTDKQDVYLQTQLRFADIEEDEREPLIIGRVFGSFSDLEAYLVKLNEQAG